MFSFAMTNEQVLSLLSERRSMGIPTKLPHPFHCEIRGQKTVLIALSNVSFWWNSLEDLGQCFSIGHFIFLKLT